MPDGQTQQFTALADYIYAAGVPSEGLPCVDADTPPFDVTHLADWNSSDTDVAFFVDPVAEPGLVEAAADDGSTATIEAELDTVSGEATLTTSP
ncbi:MAG: hypothetical protein JRI25_17570 [Deltaproteobacteria bacterium]|nr:hypothetical protein [Deltaproteobacteria bacterium]